jgi:hypothetical protein
MGVALYFLASPVTPMMQVSGGTTTASETSAESLLPDPDCDCPSGSIVVGTPGTQTLLSTLVGLSILPALPTTAQNITIRGTLVMDVSTYDPLFPYYLFPENSDICMDSGAEILVPTDNTLYIRGAHIRGCQERWKSITVENDAFLYIWGGGKPRNLIEDAQYAVHPQSKGTVLVWNTDFNKNYVGLKFDAIGDFVLSEFRSNKLYCTDTLLPHYDPLDIMNDGPWSYAGVDVKGQGALTIGVDGHVSLQNQFDSLRNGILVENTNLAVYNARFGNIQRLDYPIRGFGIRGAGEGHNFIQSGTCGVSANTIFFEDCHTGIQMEDMNVRIRNNEMTEVVSGIVVRDSPDREILICSNNIHTRQFGISLQLNDPAESILVSGNEIELSALSPDSRFAAIRVSEGGTAQPNAKITLNKDISIFNAGSGIFIAGANGWEVTQNSIEASQQVFGTLMYAGIRLWNSPNCYLSCNDAKGDFITNPGGGPTGPFGMQVRASEDVNYECNDVQSTYVGVQFDMTCVGTAFKTTSFEDHQIGLHYTTQGITGPQPGTTGDLHGNRWNGTWGGFVIGAQHDAPSLSGFSLYFVPAIPAPQGPQNPSPSSWFLPDPRNELSCGETCTLPVEDPPTDDFFLLVANGEVDPGEHSESMQYMYERSLYNRLLSNQELLESAPAFAAFMETKSSTAVGKFSEVEMDIRAIFQIGLEDHATLSSLQTQIQEALLAIGDLNVQLLSAMGNDSLELVQQREELSEGIQQLTAEQTVLSAEIKAARAQGAEALLSINAAISTSNIWESNEQAVNEQLLLSSAKGETLTIEQINILSAIAIQCPYSGGIAVFRARALLSGTLDLHYDDSAACEPNNQALIQQPGIPQESNADVKIFPNPTQNEFTIRFTEPTLHPAELRLQTSTGQTLRVYQVPEGSSAQQLSMPEGTPPGIYFLSLIAESQETRVFRIVVSK